MAGSGSGRAGCEPSHEADPAIAGLAREPALCESSALGSGKPGGVGLLQGSPQRPHGNLVEIHPPLSHRHRRPKGNPDFSDPQERATLQRGLPGCTRQKRNPARHPALRPGVLEALDRIPRQMPDRGQDALLESLGDALRHETRTAGPLKSVSASH